MYTYLKKSVNGNYVEFPTRLNSKNYNLGTTYRDYLDDKWILLSKDQLKFKSEHPGASIQQVIEMTVRERTLQDAKVQKLAEITSYDNSQEVNGFEIVGVPGKYWFTVQERLNYKQSVEAAQTLHKDQVSFYVGNMALTIDCEKALYLLAVLQDYADQCFIVTKQHQLAVETLETIPEIDSYSYTEGYPECPKFNLL